VVFGGRNPEELAERSVETVEQGYRALKLYPLGGVQVVTPQRLERAVESIEALRLALGYDIEIAVDVGCRLNMWSARRAAQMLEPFRIAWMEEPVLYDNAAALAELARDVRVPIATGERRYTRWEFRELLEKNAVGILQPDICHAGGMSELKKIAAMAETYDVPLAPHNSNGPISTIASLHFAASTPSFLMQEIVVNMVPRYNKLLAPPLQIENGQARLSEAPGWGVELREDVLARYPPAPFSPVESEGSESY